MQKKFYLLFSLFLINQLSAGAQDTARCTAAFQAIVNGSQAYFQAADSLSVVVHYWNFGDSTQVGFNHNYSTVSHAYTHPGVFTVIHIAKDSAGSCYDSTTRTVTINPDPGPLCNLSVGFFRDTVNHHLYSFSAYPYLSGGTIDTISWTINDTLVGTGDSLVNRLLPIGSYTVCASMSTSLGCRIQSCLNLVVSDSVPPVPVPTPDSCTIGFNAVQKSANQYDIEVVNPSLYDSIVWSGVRNQDSMRIGPFYGPGFTFTFNDLGCYWVSVTARTRAQGCVVYGGQLICIDSLSSAPVNLIASYPNPATTQTNLAVNLDMANTVYIRVYNSMGVLVQSTNVSGMQGMNQISLPIGNLSAGIYYIQLQYGTTIKRAKIQKL